MKLAKNEVISIKVYNFVKILSFIFIICDVIMTPSWCYNYAIFVFGGKIYKTDISGTTLVTEYIHISLESSHQVLKGDCNWNGDFTSQLGNFFVKFYKNSWKIGKIEILRGYLKISICKKWLTCHKRDIKRSNLVKCHQNICIIEDFAVIYFFVFL